METFHFKAAATNTGPAIHLKSRRTGLRKLQDDQLATELKAGWSVYVGGEDPGPMIRRLAEQGVKVTIKPMYRYPNPEPVYDNPLAIEPQIVDYIYKPGEVVGHVFSLA